MRLYGRPVRYHLRHSAAGEGSASHPWPSWVNQFSITTEASSQEESNYFDQEDSFQDQEPSHDSYLNREWDDSEDSQWAGNSQGWEEDSPVDQGWTMRDSPVGQDSLLHPDLRWPDYKQQVLVARPDVSYPLIPYWTTDRVDQSLVWLTFLTVFLVVFFLALVLGWCLQLAGKCLRRRSQVCYLKKVQSMIKMNKQKVYLGSIYQLEVKN